MNLAADPRSSRRYLCLTCEPMPEVQPCTPGADGEYRCPSCRDVMHSFPVLECSDCGEWAASEYDGDVRMFRATHECLKAAL